MQVQILPIGLTKSEAGYAHAVSQDAMCFDFAMTGHGVLPTLDSSHKKGFGEVRRLSRNPLSSKERNDAYKMAKYHHQL